MIQNNPIILTLYRLARAHEGVWPTGGAGQFTDETLQPERDTSSFGSKSQICAEFLDRLA